MVWIEADKVSRPGSGTILAGKAEKMSGSLHALSSDASFLALKEVTFRTVLGGQIAPLFLIKRDLHYHQRTDISKMSQE